jgi:hypothetical protein
MTCLTFDQIIDYINDRLSSQEKMQATKHLEECELCREAMEAAASHPWVGDFARPWSPTLEREDLTGDFITASPPFW